MIEGGGLDRATLRRLASNEVFHLATARAVDTYTTSRCYGSELKYLRKLLGPEKTDEVLSTLEKHRLEDLEILEGLQRMIWCGNTADGDQEDETPDEFDDSEDDRYAAAEGDRKQETELEEKYFGGNDNE